MIKNLFGFRFNFLFKIILFGKKFFNIISISKIITISHSLAFHCSSLLSLVRSMVRSIVHPLLYAVSGSFLSTLYTSHIHPICTTHSTNTLHLRLLANHEPTLQDSTNGTEWLFQSGIGMRREIEIENSWRREYRRRRRSRGWTNQPTNNSRLWKDSQVYTRSTHSSHTHFPSCPLSANNTRNSSVLRSLVSFRFVQNPPPALYIVCFWY